MDTLSPAERSERMRRVRSRNSAAELRVRRAVHWLGFRFRLHRSDLPGKPDLVFPKLHAVMFVHGCFWHRHAGCALARMPKSRLEFWQPKLEGNRTRDEQVQHKLEALGWRVLVVWECETTDAPAMRARVESMLRHSI